MTKRHDGRTFFNDLSKELQGHFNALEILNQSLELQLDAGFIDWIDS